LKRIRRSWAAVCVGVTLLVLVVPRVGAQVVDPFTQNGFANASGGDGGSARGGDGGGGGSGTLPNCNANTNDAWETDGWADDADEPALACPAGARGGDAGDGGVSEGGNGGIAFTVGRPPGTTPDQVRRLLADVLIRAIRLNSFDVDIANNGPDAASGVTVAFTLQGGSSFVLFDSITPPEGSTCTGQPAPDHELSSPVTMTCQLGGLAVGQVATVVINWHNSNECPETATLHATVSSTSPPDPNLTNNAGSASQTLGRRCI
jgi:hypothetical protein